MRQKFLHITVFLVLAAITAESQISPGDLSKAHIDLEGILNCTECHILGGEVSNEKCLGCHKELKSRIDNKKGYHASSEVNNKDCATCHNDHHGRNFEMIRFNEADFKHQLTGYELKGAHNRIDCRECHTTDLIADNDLKNKKNTFLGLGNECLSCHNDTHQNTLSQDCAKCHDNEAFSPASNFSHDNTDFILVGKHRNVECIECHQMEVRNKKEFQRFTDIPFQNCTACHQDVHDNKFGNNCTECHSEASFTTVVASKNFNHNMTGFKLLGKHQSVDCRQCHISSFTNPIPHNRCASCHNDYHEREFVRNQVNPDCASCHTVNGFSGSLYTLEKHNEGKFPLEGGHLATPCISCHRQEIKWRFNGIGERCVDCHENVHVGYIDEKYYPNQSCESCHLVSSWKENRFAHNLTDFELIGAHTKQDCRACHVSDDNSDGNIFKDSQKLSLECIGCHTDEHHRQFEREGTTDCKECHWFDSWEISDFDHNNTAFKLDGEHVNVDCAACHMKIEEQGDVFVQYKTKKLECIDCHQ